MLISRKRLTLIGCGITLLVVAGCFPDASQPKATIENSATPEDHPEFIIPTATSTKKPIYTQTSNVIATVTPTQLHLPTIPFTSHEDQAYQLRVPKPETLLDIFVVANLQHSEARGSYDAEELDFILNDSYLLYDAIGYELDQHYPNGLPDPAIIHTLPAIEIAYFPNSIQTLLLQGVVDYLNGEKIDLRQGQKLAGPNFIARSHQIEIDGDTGAEWLLQLDYEEMEALLFLVLDQIDDATYQQVFSDLPAYSGPVMSNLYVDIISSEDFSGDGLSDVLLYESMYFFGTIYATFHVFLGNSDGLRTQSSIDEDIFTYDREYVDFEFGDTDFSSLPTLTIRSINDINWGCRWETDRYYSWPNGKEVHRIEHSDPPDTPECYLAQAVSILDTIDFKTATTLLEKSLMLFDITSPEQFDKAQFARYRLSILYSYWGYQKAARRQFETFVKGYTTGQYSDTQLGLYLADASIPILDSDRLSPLDVCSLTYATPEMFKPWSKYITASAALKAYLGGETYPPAICPLGDMVDEILSSVSFNPSSSPETNLIAAGIPVVSTQHIEIPESPHGGWLVLLGTKPVMIIGYAPGKNGFHWLRMYSFDLSSGPPEIANQDFTGDGFDEIAFALPESGSSGCDNGEIPYEIFLTTHVGHGSIVSVSWYSCSPEEHRFDFETFLADKNGDGLVDWVMENLDEEQSLDLTFERFSPLSWLTQDEAENLLESEDQETESRQDFLAAAYETEDRQALRIELFKLRDALSPTDIGYHLQWQFYTYVIAVSYEMDGDVPHAVDHYLEVVKSRPQSLWSNLAFSHLELLN